MGKTTTGRRPGISGHPGIGWDSRRKRWIIRVCYHAKVYSMNIADLDEAVQIKKEAEAQIKADTFLDWHTAWKAKRIST